MKVKRFNAQGRAARTCVKYCFNAMLCQTAVLQSVACIRASRPEWSAGEVKACLSFYISQLLDEMIQD